MCILCVYASLCDEGVCHNTVLGVKGIYESPQGCLEPKGPLGEQ